MGANEKHAATYHGGEYVPTPDEARATWVLAMAYSKSRIEPLMQSFDRMIAKVRAEAKAEALNEAADWVRDNGGDLVSRGIEDELLNRANQYKEDLS
ncbi:MULTISPECIES: hypothetical protein [Actinomycetes]|uniref:hypothetical protein n=1 Tax=Actinomycetes TaxID=1760 RepID=UPI003423677B